MEVLRPRRLRAVGLLAFGYSCAYLLVLILANGTRQAIVVDDLGNLISPTVAAVACVLAARRCQDAVRRFWALLAAFAGVWALGQLAWCWYEVVQNTAVPFPGLPDLGYVASIPLVLLALLLHPAAPRFTSGVLRLTADAVLVATCLLAATWRLALGDAYRTAGGHGFAQVLGLSYPLFDVLVLTLLLLVGVRARGAENRPFLWVAACLGSGAIGHVVYGVLAQNGAWQSGNPVDAAWGVGFLFLALGAHSETGVARAEVAERTSSNRASLLPFLPLALLAVIAVAEGLQGRHTDQLSRALGFVIFASVLVRQVLAIVENNRLTRGLEALVDDRTAALLATSERLRQQAGSDPLTGLPNRSRLFADLQAALEAGPLVVALLDLDGFKSVNDSLGHAAGDALLTTIGKRFETQLPAEVRPARLGGDEFAFLLTGQASDLQVRTFGAEILRVLAAPVEIGNRSLTVTGSLGIVIAGPEDTAESLLRNADVAMYAAKESGKDRLRLFEPAMRAELLSRVALESDLRAALVAGDVVPWFQPVVDLATGRMQGVEALARWTKDGVAVSPGVFVPLAEQCGLVSLLGRQILRAACAHAAQWTRHGPLTLSVNLSAVQLAGEDLVDQVREALLDTGLDPRFLVLEITETVLMEDAESVGPRLEALRALGVRIALDDFGTGYSALGYLQKIPVDIVKIDRIFVRDLHLGARQSALAAAVMTLAEALDLDVVAEGIELPEQAARLRELGCRLGQGFLFDAALPAEQLAKKWHRQVQESETEIASL